MKTRQGKCDKNEITHEQWEAKCSRCGRCCFEKIEYNNKIYLTDIPCEYLDLTTKECTVYAQRSQKKPDCVAINEAIIALGVLPRECAYVEDDQYDAPISWKYLPQTIRDNFCP